MTTPLTESYSICCRRHRGPQLRSRVRPGQLLQLLVTRDPVAQVCGVDPSRVMVAQAHRRLRRLGAAERSDLRLGAAGALPFPDRHVDHVVAVNTAAMWPDLQAALVDPRRVMRPGGTLLIAWHSAHSPRRVQRALARPERGGVRRWRRCGRYLAKSTATS
ncbi:class I SAM-dependent methyltransferase [Micromonospora sp. NPDC007271]|uniref:class I SAM-dependent methyltransferase n=1 Tax=Micromonospora sp. NPDC007271 TaxID=3154587 RepID=UPI0033DA1423